MNKSKTYGARVLIQFNHATEIEILPLLLLFLFCFFLFVIWFVFMISFNIDTLNYSRIHMQCNCDFLHLSTFSIIETR